MKIPVHNPTAMTMFVHGLMILPGETRHVDEELVPAHLRPAPAADEPVAAPADPLAELLAQPVKKITAALAGISLDQLDALRTAELAADTPRKTLLSAIDEEFLNRAIAAEDAGDAEAAARVAAMAGKGPGA